MENEQVTSESEAEKIVDALNAVFGRQVHNRAVHAKGIVVQGIFTPSPAAARLCSAPHFQSVTAVTARFSLNSGNPAIADTDPLASPRGMAVKFHLPRGTETDVIGHSFNGFPVATADEFRQLFEAIARSGAGVAHPNPLERFLAEHPRAKAFLEAPNRLPSSFVTLRYFGVNSFALVDGDGRRNVGRYRFEPAAGEQLLSPSEAAASEADYLRNELRRRLEHVPAHLLFNFQLAAPGDLIDDPSQAWPEDRPIVTLGTLELQKVVADSATVELKLMFSPSALVAGIEAADPMIEARDAAYQESYRRRRP
jgi:catalase